MAAPPGWRHDASPDMVVLSVGKCLGSLMDKGLWLELGLLTSTRERLEGHPRLLRSLFFGDEDYLGCVYDVTPWVLGALDADPASGGGLSERFPHLQLVSDFVDVPSWLAKKEPALHSQVCSSDGTDPAATLPDGTVLDAAETAAGRLEVAEMRRQVDRIRRDYEDDPEALVGHSKELVESACKTILGLTGTGPETEQDVPALVAQTLRHLGLHPESLGDGRDPTEAKALKRIFGGLSTILQGAAELRNARGTGHGRSGVPLLDKAMGQLVAGMVLPTVVYLCEAYEASTSSNGPSLRLVDPPVGAALEATPPRPPPGFTTGLDVVKGAVVNHSTFGRGEVTEVKGAGVGKQAVVDFPEPIGRKRLVLKHAPLQLVQL
ncbi:MAG: abortive infection family protein [Nocardioidaceae bacterium]